MVFVYGTLKRGFPNHSLLVASATPFVGAASTAGPASLIIGPYSVPFLLPTPASASSGRVVSGELYAEALWRRCGGEEAEIGEYTVDHAGEYVPKSERLADAAGLIDAIHRFVATATDNRRRAHGLLP
ncbi:AIG2-like (avirulence induced gene) family protein [Zea mays]|uniref:Gamma-glutamylcyclotransferase family protein n=1 Tax=Zea mays TaxID=4577 RepID=A0A1D6IBA6_MAIZE|nr:AIG2-like (avirulence induced gene) family protein [Zea mays]